MTETLTGRQPDAKPMRRLKLFIMALSALTFAAAAAVAGWTLCSEAGLNWVLGQAALRVPGKLVFGPARGSLAGGTHIERIEFTGPDIAVVADAAELRLSVPALLRLSLHVTHLRAARLKLAIQTDPTRRVEPPRSLRLPLALQVDEVRIMHLQVIRGTGSVDVANLAFSYAGDGASHAINGLGLEWAGVAVTGGGRVAAAPPFATDGRFLARKTDSASFPPHELTATLVGNLHALQAQLRLQAGKATAVVDTTLTPFGAEPVSAVSARIGNLDLAALNPTLPRTAITGSLTLERKTRAGPLGGAVKLDNPVAGPLDQQRLPLSHFSAQLLTDLRSAMLTDILLHLGTAGRAAGNGQLAAAGARLTLRTGNLNLAGLHGRLRKTGLTGNIELDLQPGQQSARIRLTERDIELAVYARRSGDQIDMPEVSARARGGVARGSGRVSLAGAQAFSASAKLDRFNPAAWGAFPDGHISGEASATGNLTGGRLALSFALDSASQLRNAPLTGGGSLQFDGSRIAQAAIRIGLGPNSLTAKGAFGAAGDTLVLRLDAPRPALIDTRLAGEITATAQVRGTREQPGAEFEARARNVILTSGIRVTALNARGSYGTTAEQHVTLSARMRGLSMDSIVLDDATLDVQGSRLQHRIDISARGGLIDLVARARGNWSPPGVWTGEIVEGSNRGKLLVLLNDVITVQASPEQLLLGRFSAQIAGGRIDFGEARYAAGAIVSSGTFANLPLAPLLMAGDKAVSAADTLRLAGKWSLDTAKGGSGGFEVRRESGDLLLDKLQLGLQTMQLQGRLEGGALNITGDLDARLAKLRIEATLGQQAGAAGWPIGRDSPLKLSGRMTVPDLAVFAVFNEAAAHVEGKALITLTASGTLGKPQVRGTIEGDQLAYIVPPQGVHLRNGVLRGHFSGRALTVERFTINGGRGVLEAQGKLGPEGQATLKWQARQFGVLDRPDRRLAVTGQGSASYTAGIVSLSGALQADEGLFRIGTTGLPVPGNDVKVLGRPVAPPGRAGRMQGARLDVRIDLGRNLRVQGRGLNTGLRGQIRLFTDAGGALRAEGTVSTWDGSYAAFGQNLHIRRGRLLFAGPVDNPGLDIIAMRTNQLVEAGIAVSGTVNAPLIRIVSEPAVPEGEALSWLMLGRAPGETSAADLAMLPLAAASLLGSGTAASPAASLARALGVDSIGVRGGTTLNEQVVTVGKRLNERVQVVYEQGIAGAGSLLRLELTLTRRVLLRAEAGEVSAIGVFYRYLFE